MRNQGESKKKGNLGDWFLAIVAIEDVTVERRTALSPPGVVKCSERWRGGKAVSSLLSETWTWGDILIRSSGTGWVSVRSISGHDKPPSRPEEGLASTTTVQRQKWELHLSIVSDDGHNRSVTDLKDDGGEVIVACQQEVPAMTGVRGPLCLALGSREHFTA